ncbi:UNVERIFIED_CONTAM: tc3a [Trichonephila clavipes]
MTSAHDDRHLLRMGVNNRTASSGQLAARWSTATGVLMSALSIRQHLLHRGLHESHFNFFDHDGRIRVRRYAVVRCLPECVIERHSDPTPGIMVWGVISYLGRSYLLRIIEENLNSSKYSREMLQTEQDNARLHVATTVRDFCLAQNMQLLSWPTYSHDMCPMEHAWGLVGWRLTRDPRPGALKDEFCCAFKQYGILFHNQTFKIFLTPYHVV